MPALYSRNGFVTVFSMLMIVLSMWGTPPAGAEDEDQGGMVSCVGGRMNVDAREVRPEELVKELGDKCGIKVVVHGEVFSEVPVSLKFNKMPMKKGIERVLRVTNISNYILHFKDSDNGTSTLAGLDLIGKKGGEKHLTSGSASTPVRRPEPVEKSPRKRIKKKRKKKLEKKPEDEMDAKIQENFLRVMDEVLKSQLEDGEEPDPAEVLKLFKDVVPPEMKDQIPPEVLEELEKLEKQ